MKLFNIKNMWRGWFIGDFDPSVYKTKEFEIGILKHNKGEFWPKHYHKISTEINYLISGKMKIKDTEINSGDIFILEPFEIADPIFLEDCILVTTKIPSTPGDKYEV